MKKIDKLVFGSFIGPFLLTLIVVDFILLLVTLLKYFDQIMGKGLSLATFGELIAYFSISSTPDAFPLAVLLSSIMTFGNLGEHSELTAVKSSGISLVRSLLPIFVFVLGLTAFTYYSNTRLVPKVNLETYSLLWDMRTKKPALDIKQGVFYDGIPGYSIKVNDKIDDENLRDIIIYDHVTSKAAGNRTVILADSGRMYSFMNQRYMALELYDGVRYEEAFKETYNDRVDGGQFRRDAFDESKIVFDLSSFEMGDTDQSLFRRSRLVQTRNDLIVGIDSMQRDLVLGRERLYNDVSGTFRYHFVKRNTVPTELVLEREYHDSVHRARREARGIKPKKDTAAFNQLVDTLGLQAKTPKPNTSAPNNLTPRKNRDIKSSIDPSVNSRSLNENIIQTGELVSRVKKKRIEKPKVYPKEYIMRQFDKAFDTSQKNFNNTKMTTAINQGVTNSRTMRTLLKSRMNNLETLKRDQRKFLVTKNQQMSRSLACLIMFLIGAPIGAIIKKGGLGLPVIVSVVFFLIYYILNTTGDKWGKEGVFDPAIAVWISNAVLLPIGLFFLKQARNDARLFEPDFYLVWWQKLKNLFQKRKQLTTT